jgi:hypothetical protein
MEKYTYRDEDSDVMSEHGDKEDLHKSVNVTGKCINEIRRSSIGKKLYTRVNINPKNAAMLPTKKNLDFTVLSSPEMVQNVAQTEHHEIDRGYGSSGNELRQQNSFISWKTEDIVVGSLKRRD